MARIKPPIPKPIRRLPSGRVPRAAIRRYVDQVVARFQPEKVILFGSHAYGRPNADSDVDLLVVMPAYDEINQSIRIENRLEAPFLLDLIVRTPKNLAYRLKWNDWFMREVVEKGIVLHDANDPGMAPKRRCRSSKRALFRPKPTDYDIVCYHCQQAVEKYLKGHLQELGTPISKTHNLKALVNLILPSDPTIKSLRPQVHPLTKFAVDYRYPGYCADRRKSLRALAVVERVSRRGPPTARATAIAHRAIMPFTAGRPGGRRRSGNESGEESPGSTGAWWWVTPTTRKGRESATEKIPPTGEW